MIVVWIILLVLILGYIAVTYNKFVNLKNSIEAEEGQINVALKKRLDMISQLVDAVKGSIKFEKDVMQHIADARKAINTGNIKDALAKTNFAATRIYAVMENYPELKAQENIKELLNSIKDVENEIARHRYVYNNIVQEYNILTERFPSVLVASLLGFKKKPYLEFEEEIKERPKVNIYE